MKLAGDINDIIRRASDRAFAALDEEDRRRGALVGRTVFDVMLAGKPSTFEHFDCILFTDGSTVRFDGEVKGDYQEGPKQNGQDAKLDELKRLLLAQATLLAEQGEEIRALKERLP